MAIYDEKQQILSVISCPTARKSNWKDWKWQLKHSIRGISSFEKLTGTWYPKFYLKGEFRFMICDEPNVSQMVEVYRKVFKTYPFPIHDPQYIMKTIHENFIYFSVWKKNMIISLSSSEIDIGSQNVEMRDFAALLEYRGNGSAIYLLYNKMEEEIRKKQMKTAYTISSEFSHGSNIIFIKMGYRYGGILLKLLKTPIYQGV
jgi:putative beta-lysine N-acetyltransferase